MTEEITTGSRIRLKHINTGRTLHSSNITTESGSKDQLVCGWDLGENADDWWIVKGEHGKPLPEGHIVEYAGVIRLEHASSRKNLHCYFDAHLRAPSGKQGVCAYGEKGEGDIDDNWIIEKFVTSGSGFGKWQRSSIVRFRHQQTGRYLHSHPWMFVLGDGTELQEVCVRENADVEGDRWVVDMWQPPFPTRGVAPQEHAAVLPHPRHVHHHPTIVMDKLRDGSRAMLLGSASMKHLRDHPNGNLDAGGDFNDKWETFQFKKTGEDTWQLWSTADPSRCVRIYDGGNGLDARGNGDANCDFAISELGREHISLRSRAFPLAFIGARENGEIKTPNDTREDKYGQWWVSWV